MIDDERLSNEEEALEGVRTDEYEARLDGLEDELPAFERELERNRDKGGVMARARYRGKEYDLLNFSDNAEWVLRDSGNNVVAFEDGERERVEVKCERCGRWSTSAAPAATGRWVCHDGKCSDEEE
jgi:hypothetical protein